MILVEDAAASRSPVRDRSPHFPLSPAFHHASYLQRYDLLCQRLMMEQLYSSAAVIATARDAAASGSHRSLSEMSSLKTFITHLAGHVAGVAARLG